MFISNLYFMESSTDNSSFNHYNIWRLRALIIFKLYYVVMIILTMTNPNANLFITLKRVIKWRLPMDYLLEGLLKFRTQDYEEHKHLFCRLKSHQEPHTLFITCSDSRVVPQLITKSLPGDLFVVRNIANIIPRHTVDYEHAATASAIEYAVKILKVKTIIICGHSNCGGCSAIHLPEEVLNKIPATKTWLDLAENVKTRVMAEMKANGKLNDIQYREWLTEQMNIVEQIKHLLTYPFVVELYNKNELEIIGMYYTIETGEVFIYDSHKGSFVLVN